MHVVDVAVVGAGPGGLMAALRTQRSGGSCLLLDAGPSLHGRVERRIQQPSNESLVVSGFGGAGLFSDGKLCLSPRIGTTFSRRFRDAEISERQRQIDASIRCGESAPMDFVTGADMAELMGDVSTAGLEYLHYPVRHVGSDQLPRMLGRLQARLEQADVDIWCNTRCIQVDHVPAEPLSRWRIEVDRGGQRTAIGASFLILAPGKVGAAWLSEVGDYLRLPRDQVFPKVGFRVEGPREFVARLSSVSSDPKLIMRGEAGAEARTHCVCYGGDVVPARYDDLVLVGGHSRSAHDSRRSNTAVIASDGRCSTLTARTVRNLVRCVNRAAGGGVAAQELGSYIGHVRTVQEVRSRSFEPSMASVTRVDFRVLYPASINALLSAFLRRLGQVCPDVLRPDNILYGPAVERWASRFTVSDAMETELEGLFLVGDGPGLTGGIIGAGESGWLAGDEIERRRTLSQAPQRRRLG